MSGMRDMRDMRDMRRYDPPDQKTENGGDLAAVPVLRD